jgi:hypothetical protein
VDETQANPEAIDPSYAMQTEGRGQNTLTCAIFPLGVPACSDRLEIPDSDSLVFSDFSGFSDMSDLSDKSDFYVAVLGFLQFILFACPAYPICPIFHPLQYGLRVNRIWLAGRVVAMAKKTRTIPVGTRQNTISRLLRQAGHKVEATQVKSETQEEEEEEEEEEGEDESEEEEGEEGEDGDVEMQEEDEEEEKYPTKKTSTKKKPASKKRCKEEESEGEEEEDGDDESPPPKKKAAQKKLTYTLAGGKVRQNTITNQQMWRLTLSLFVLLGFIRFI